MNTAWWLVFECRWVFIVPWWDKEEVHFLNRKRDGAGYSCFQPLTTSTPAHSHSAFHFPPVLFSLLYINTLVLQQCKNTDHHIKPRVLANAFPFFVATGCWKQCWSWCSGTRSAKHHERMGELGWTHARRLHLAQPSHTQTHAESVEERKCKTVASLASLCHRCV